MYAFPSICISFLFSDVILRKRLSQGKGGELLQLLAPTQTLQHTTNMEVQT